MDGRGNTISLSPETTTIAYNFSQPDQIKSEVNLHLNNGIPSPIDHADVPVKNGSVSSGIGNLNPRSCVTCRKRKVKCDKRHPCSNCNRAAIECVFPGPGRAPRRSRKPQDTDLLARLRRLEGVVQSLGSRGPDGEDLSTPMPGQDGSSPLNESGQTNGVPITGERVISVPSSSAPSIQGNTHDETAGDTNVVIKEFGRLVVEDGRSRYVSNKFWTSLSEEVAEMKDILDDPTDDDEEYPSPGASEPASNNQGFIFSFSSIILSLRNFHPTSAQITIYWDIFKSNVDPIMKLFHIPTTETIVLNAAKDLDHISKATEVLMFSMYFASITTMPANECMIMFGIDKDAALRKYRFATEQALARAGFLNTSELVILQALVLFLTCVRRTDTTRYAWTLTGLLIRLANALGIHRDGQQFDLSPFETELRRRLWWQIVTLDVRASEDHGCDPSIAESSFDTKIPLNINDDDITPESKETPIEHEGATQMTFDLMRYSVSATVRRLSYAPAGPGPCRIKNNSHTLEDKEKMIEDLHQHLEQKFLRHLDTKNVPIHWVTGTVARIILAKMWLVVHHPLQRSSSAQLTHQTRERLFDISVELIEFARLLETEKTTLKWTWLFHTYVQWHALAFVLSQLCTRTIGPMVDRAWRMIEDVFDEWGGAVSANHRGMLWKPLRKLMIKARRERTKALQARAQFPLNGSLGRTASFPLDNQASVREQMTDNLNGIGLPPAAQTVIPQDTSYGSPLHTNPIRSHSESNEPAYTNGFSSPFLKDANSLNNAPLMSVEDNTSWSGWDDLIKDFDMEGTPDSSSDTLGSPFGGAQDLANWL